MSSVQVQGNASGTGVLTIAAPNTNSNYTITLPAATTTLTGTDATQTLTNKTLTSPTITGAVVSSMASSVITSGTAVASTSGTSITFSSIPSWVKRITIILVGVSTSGTSPPQIQIGAGSVTTTGYLGSSSVLGTSGAASANFTTGFGIGVNTAQWTAAQVGHGAFTLTNFGSNTWVCTGNFGMSTTAANFFTGGSLALGGTLDRVVITTLNGTDTFDAGSINILYE
jgi:hypothetical protein